MPTTSKNVDIGSIALRYKAFQGSN